MSVFDNHSKDDLEMEIRNFLEENTITDLLEVVKWCIESKVEDMLAELKGENKMTITTCDICGKEMPTMGKGDNFNIVSHGRVWDICSNCREELNKWLKSRKENSDDNL